MEEMFRMTPPRSIMSRAKTWVVISAAVTFRSNTKRTPSGSRSKNVRTFSFSRSNCSSSVVPRGLLPPAPLMRMSHGPSWSSTVSRASRRLSPDRQFACTAMARPPAAAMRSATACAAAPFRSTTATFAPHWASASENALHRTPPPPVTTATFPVRSG